MQQETNKTIQVSVPQTPQRKQQNSKTSYEMREILNLHLCYKTIQNKLLQIGLVH